MEQRWLPATTTTRELTVQRASEAPAWVAQAGDAARFAFEEFFYGRIRNPYTRKAYLHALRVFSTWCTTQEIDLVQVTPGQVGRYLDSLAVAVPTRKVHLSALRRFFDELVLRHVLILNPALSVRAERYQAVEGRTPEIGVEQARRLLNRLNISHVVGLRDRAVIGILIYTAARVGAVAKLRRSDFYEVAGQACLRFHEKGGKVREIPLRHVLKFLQTYLDLSGLQYAEPSASLFRTTVRRTRGLTQNRMSLVEVLKNLGAKGLPSVQVELSRLESEERVLGKQLRDLGKRQEPLNRITEDAKTFIRKWEDVGELLDSATDEERMLLIRHYVEVVGTIVKQTNTLTIVCSCVSIGVIA